LKSVLVSAFPNKQSTYFEPRTGKNRNRKERFSFNDLDTVRYWYDELGRLFGMSGDSIAQMAEKYICDEWGFDGNILNDNHVKIPDRDYYLTSNNHGIIPQVEDLRNYYEYHAMFYVANELIETKPLVTFEYSNNDLNEWIDAWCTTWNDYWLADLRDATPWEADLWRPNEHERHQSESWLYALESKDFDNKLYSKDYRNHPFDEWIIVDASYGKNWRKDHENIQITSSLVNTERSRSLLNALQTIVDPIRFKLPLAHESGMEFQENGFNLKGWINRISSENEGEDDKDNYANYLYKTCVLPGDEFTKWATLIITPDHRFGFDKTENLVTQFQNWSDFDDHSKYPKDFGSKGYRLLIKKDVLLSFLMEKGYSLILECKVNRRVEKGYNSENHSIYTPDNFKLFLIHADGTTETINGSNNRVR
jgi:hypothetical protein